MGGLQTTILFLRTYRKESFPNVLVSTANNTNPGFLKTADAEISLPYSGKAIEKYDMRFFFGRTPIRS